MKKRFAYMLLGSLLVMSMTACEIQPASDTSNVDSTGVVGYQEETGSEEESRDQGETSDQDETGAVESIDNTDDKVKMIDEQPDKKSTEEQSDDSDDIAKTDLPTSTGIIAGTDLDYDAMKSEKELYILEQLAEKAKMFVVDKDGKSYGVIDREDFTEKLKTKGLDFEYDYISCISEGVAFVKHLEQQNEAPAYVVYAIDLNTLEMIPILKVASYCIDAIEYYQGAIHITYEEDGILKEAVFVKDGDAFSYTRQPDQLELVSNAMAGYEDYYLPRKQESVREYKLSLGRCLDENGYVVIKRDGQFLRVGKDGSVVPLKVENNDSPEENYNGGGWVISDYNPNYICFYQYSENAGTKYYLYDIAKDTFASMFDGLGSFDFLGVVGDYLYLATDHSTEYGLEDNVICRLALNGKDVETLYEVKEVPGADIYAGTQNWTMIGDNIYYVGFDNGKFVWMKKNINEPKKEHNTGFIEQEIPLFQYGKVDSVSATSYCKKCQIVLERFYTEGFVLDEKYSDQADKINAYMKQQMEESIADVKPEKEPNGKGLCESHQKYPSNFCETTESRVKDVRIISGKYLAVDHAGYWYGGGNGGFGIRKENLFDLKSGEALSLKDFYKGTEEEFKELVARKTKEDSQSHTRIDGDYSPYYEQDPEKLYKQAYDLVRLDGSITFKQDGILYNFYPETLAMGFAEVFISYEDLLGRTEL